MAYKDFIKKIESKVGYQLPVDSDIYYGIVAGHSEPFGRVFEYSASIPLGNKTVVAVLEGTDSAFVLMLNDTIDQVILTSKYDAFALEHGKLGNKDLFDKYNNMTSEYAKHHGIGLEKFQQLKPLALTSL